MKIYARIEVFDGETGRDIVDAEASADCVSDALNDAYELAWGKLNEDLDADDEDEDEFSLGLIERPEPTMAELNAQGLWDCWMESARAVERYSFPQRFVVGLDPNCPPDSYYVFSEAPVLIPNGWARGIEVEWGAREPVAFTRANKQAFTDLIEATVLSHSAFDFGDSDHDFTD